MMDPDKTLRYLRSLTSPPNVFALQALRMNAVQFYGSIMVQEDEQGVCMDQMVAEHCDPGMQIVVAFRPQPVHGSRQLKDVRWWH